MGVWYVEVNQFRSTCHALTLFMAAWRRGCSGTLKSTSSDLRVPVLSIVHV